MVYQKRYLAIMILGMMLIALPALAQEKATPEEIIIRVRAAAEYLSQAGEPGLTAFNQNPGDWVWKDTYIFVYNCAVGTIAAHPEKPDLIGKPLLGLKDVKGNLFFVQLCDAAKLPKGDWVTYWWPKPGEKAPSRKISYMLQVPGTPYQVGAGIYDENESEEKLNFLVNRGGFRSETNYKLSEIKFQCVIGRRYTLCIISSL